MLASLLSLPSAAVAGTASFLSNRRRGLTYTAGVLGGAYVLGQWAVQRMVDTAERGRKESWDREDLSRRFSLNLQDSQFTVLALLPTVASQLQHELDVEARSKALSELARRDKEKRAQEARQAQLQLQLEAERDEQAQQDGAESSQDDSAAPGAAAKRDVDERDGQGAEPEAPQADGAVEVDSTTGVNGSSLDPATDSQAGSVDEADRDPAPSTESPSPNPPLAPSTLWNPDAPVFQPRSLSPPANNVTQPAQTPAIVESDGSSSVLGKSWAEIVKTEPPASNAAVVEPEALESSSPSNGLLMDGTSASEGIAVNGDASHEAKNDGEEPTVEASPGPAVPDKSKAKLWNEIKLLAFTRLVTSLYVLVLLSLQTHVQLALLGRASYVDSLLSVLPPRSPSPRPATILPADPVCEKPSKLEPNGCDDDDLERALYEAKRLPPTADEQRVIKARERKDLERKYLTFSWWLLHEGWKVVRERVEQAVEEVIGPMSLKAPLVYGELGALFGEIRRRVELDASTGKPFDFSSANHPPTLALEIQTLVSGGSYVPPPPASSSSSSHSFPPSSSSPIRDDNPVTPTLRLLLNETNDALESPDGALVRALSLDRLFSLVVEKLEPAFSSASSDGTERGARFEDVTEKQTRLASLLPHVTRLAAVEAGVLASGVNSNDFVEALEDVRELREFSAVLYGSWDRDNIDASCGL